MKRTKGLINKIQKWLAVSEQGAHSFLKAVGWTALQNMTAVFPMMLVYLMIQIVMKSTGIATEHIFWVASLVLLFIILMYAAANRQYKSTYSAVYAESANMRVTLAEHLRRLPLSFFDKKNASDLSARIMGDVAMLENGYSHQIPQLVGAFLMLLFAMIGLIALDWRLALALTWVVPVALILFVVTLKWQKREMLKSTQIQLEMNEKMEEGFKQVQTIKASSQEARYLRELDAQLNNMEKAQMSMELFAGVIINVVQAIVKLSLPTLAIVGSALYIKGAVAPDVLLFFLLVAISIFDPLTVVFMNSSVWAFYSIKVDRMNEIYDMPLQKGLTNFSANGYDIEFEHVDFSYQDGKKVLTDVSFAARQGQTTALIGPSGGGKSTCARLASRFWDVDRGEVKLGGRNIKTLDPETLLQYYSIIFQDVVLFNASIAENIRVGRKDASDEEVRRAAELAQCQEFVSKLPNGYNTMIGENGARLSGGERQRISIARAILKDAPIVIMDEATASQDAENESLIQQALSSLIHNKTVIVIAHRMRTIANVDHIVVLEDGKVVEQGTPKQLYQQNGLYTRMLNAQTSPLHA